MDKPVSTALLSYGMSGEVFHAPLLASIPEFKLSAIVQRKGDKAKSHFPDARIYRTVEEVINDPEIELVIVNTPNETHVEFAANALEAGKHVVVEKPFTVTSEEAERLMHIAERKGVVLTVFQNRRWDGDFLTVQQIVKEGGLGKIVEFEAHYDRFRNYIEPDTWKEEDRPGTGILYNLGSHMLDQTLVLFGMPHSVDARLGIQRPGGKVNDFYDIRMEYPTHLAIIKSSYLVKADLPRYIIHGTNGSFVKYGLDPQEQALKDKRDPRSPDWGAESESTWGTLTTTTEVRKIPTLPGNYAAFYKNVCAAIRKGAGLSVSAEQGARVIQLIEACQQSAREKRAVILT